MRRPLYYLLVALIGGIVCGYYFNFHAADYVSLAILVSALIALPFAIIKKLPNLCLFIIFFILLATGFFNIQKEQYSKQNKNHIINHIDRGKQIWEGVIIDSPEIHTDKTIFIVRLVRTKENGIYNPVSGNVRLIAPPDLNLQYGDYIRFSSRIKRIQSFYNPGGFNYERYMNMKNIYATAYVSNSAKIILLRKNAANALKGKIERYRLYLKKMLQQYAPSPQREIIEAMTLGNRSGIPTELRDSFNKTGTAHLLAISGLHVGIVFLIGFLLLSFPLKLSEYFLLRFNIANVAAVGAFFFVIIYASVAGMGVTVIRATLMTLAVIFAFLTQRQKDAFNILALAALVILIFSPHSLFDISFQLSFCAVFSILYLSPVFSKLSFSAIESWPHWIQTFIKNIYLMSSVCIAATIGTFPLLIFYFNRLSVITVFANLIAVILLGTISLTLAMGFIISAFLSVPLAALFVKTTSFFVKISTDIIEKLASLPWSSLTVTKPNILEIFIFYLLAFFMVQSFDSCLKEENKKKFLQKNKIALPALIAFCLLFFIFNAVYLFVKPKLATDLKITAIDVGQGSATFVRFPKGKHMLIDGGGFADSSFDMGKTVIAPFLYAQRISTIHTVILSHPHPDHLQGLLYIIDNFNVEEIWLTGQRADDELFAQWEKIIQKKNIKVNILNAKSPPIQINSVVLNILWPPATPSYVANDSNYQKVNDDSLVIKMTYDKINFLFPADISSKIEKYLIESQKSLKSDVIFVPHHGSRNSSSTDFIKAVSSRYAVISAGENNLFHHPHQSTLDRYINSRVKIYRTDESGAITITTNGVNLFIDTYIKTNK